MENESLPEPALTDPREKLILLVDDDESLLDIVEHVVRREGFRTDRAVDGPQALLKAQALLPDLILLDYMLPGKGGYEVLRELQSIGHGDIPIIIITGRNLDEKQIALIRQEPNVRDFLIKPMRPPVLTALLHTILKTRPSGLRGG